MKNITELRKSLSDNYSKMKSGEMQLETGKALAGTAGKIINTLKVELEYNRTIGVEKEIDFLKSSDI